MPSVRPAWPLHVAVGLGRGLHLAWRAAGRGLIEFYNSDNLTFAASIAFYALLSLFPFILLIITILSNLRVGPSDAGLLQIITSTLPSRFDFLVARVQELDRAPLKLSVAGALVTLLASMGVFGAITSAVDQAWGVEKRYGFFKHKLVAIVMLLAAGLLMGTALLLIGTVQVIHTTWFARAVGRLPALAAFGGFAYRNAPTPLFVVVVGLICYFVPNTRVRLRDVWSGALIAGLLWRLAFAVFSWYVSDLSRFSVHGSIAAVVAFLIWVYISAVILLYGVEVSASYARLRPQLAVDRQPPP
jgi:membrane protein